MSQLDFAATLALLLGLPVPFGNVGTVDARMWAAAWEGPVKGRSWGQASGLGGGERREGPGGRGEEALRTRSGSGCVRACVDGGSDDLGDLGACAAEWVDGAGDAGKVGEVRKVRDRRGCTHARGKGSCAALGAEAGGCRREGCAASGAADAGLGWEAGAEGHAMSPDHSWQHSYLEALTLTSMQVCVCAFACACASAGIGVGVGWTAYSSRMRACGWACNIRIVSCGVIMAMEKVHNQNPWQQSMRLRPADRPASCLHVLVPLTAADVSAAHAMATQMAVFIRKPHWQQR